MALSGLPPIVTDERTSCWVRVVPRADLPCCQGIINSRGVKPAPPIRPKVNVHRTIGRSCGSISLVSLESASDDLWFPGAALARANLVASNERSP